MSNLQIRRNMKKYILSAIFAACALVASAWGQKGHDVTAYIAEQHLTPTTKAAVDKILDGRSMVYWSNWLDNASNQMDYAYTKTWHYKNVDADETYESSQANPSGDVVVGIKQQIEVLSDQTTTPDRAALAMKILIHLMGDMHQPMHMGHATDLGGNRIKVKFFSDERNLHSVWDSSILESGHKWSYTEWQQQIDRASDAEEVAIVEGRVDDWAKETLAVAKDVYVYFQPGTRVMYNEIARWTPTIEQQLLKAGLRLAHVLNLIYGSEYK